MQGLMMDVPLLISLLISHADRYHGDTEIASQLATGEIHRYTYRQAHQRTRQLANALRTFPVNPGDRIATLAWNSYRHLEVYYATPGIGAVCHTINPRLFPDQIAYIVNHAADRMVFFDLSFIALVESIAALCPTVERWIALCNATEMPAKAAIPGLTCYESWIEAHADAFDWPNLDERSAAGLCYTSGTTGNPKGVLYSHRSTILHAYAAALPDVLNLSARDVVLPAVPMFHVNAWGLPYSSLVVGAKLVFPGPHLDGKSLQDLFESEGVTMTAGVPTVWLGLLQHLRQHSARLTTLKRIVIGGSAAPPAMIQEFAEVHGVQVIHAWGMTEMSPLGTAGTLKAKHDRLPEESRFAIQCKQGRPIFGVEMKIVDGTGNTLPCDGKAFGDLMVRGPWVTRGYFAEEAGSLHDGWFATGDVATIDEDGYMQITDRSKDVIKSGGEWISSIELENIAIAHPAVAEAAVIGARHPKWDERPLLLVVLKPGTTATREDILSFYLGKVAKWWIPDDVLMVASLPHTATGKLLKTRLRADFAGHLENFPLPTSPTSANTHE